MLEVAPRERPVDVAGGEHEQAAGARDPGDLGERRARLAQVLDHVPHRHDVELTVAELGVRELAGEHAMAELSRAYCDAYSETSTPVTS